MCPNLGHISSCLIRRNPIPHNPRIPHGISILLANISAGIALNGMHIGTITAFYNPNMIGCSVAAPVEKDDPARLRDNAPALPLPPPLKPLYSSRAIAEFRNDPSVDIPTLVGYG